MIYLDNAATTKPAPEVVSAMLPYIKEAFGNPSAVCRPGAEAKKALTESRDQVASLIGAKPDEIFFTSGGSEADNWALTAVFDQLSSRGNHIITTGIEHPAVLRTCEYLQRFRGAQVTYLDVDENGFVDPAAVEAAITDQTILISVMAANNEIGTIEPIAEIADIAHAHGILIHTDAVQAYGQIPFTVDDWHVDLLSASGHKFNGPKGTGFLYIRRGTQIGSFIHGGAQERNRRAGTENVPGIVGMGKAAELAAAGLEEKICRETELRNYLIRQIREKITCCRLNGPDPLSGTVSTRMSSLQPSDGLNHPDNHPDQMPDMARRLPGNVNFSFEFAEGESIVIMLDMQGICASSGSACSSGSLSPSHVLKSIGLPDDLAKGAVRFTLSGETTKEELDKSVDVLVGIVDRLRSMSANYAAYCRRTGNSDAGE